jgi:hypothetical protein
MADGAETPPQGPPHFRREGPGAILSFEMKGPRDATVVMTVDHRNEADTEWLEAGTLSALTPTVSALRVSHLKENLRLRFSVAGDAADGPADVRVLPPEWLPW